MANENNTDQTNREATKPAPEDDRNAEQKTAPAERDKNEPAQK